jgi:hypothetical protein
MPSEPEDVKEAGVTGWFIEDSLVTLSMNDEDMLLLGGLLDKTAGDNDVSSASGFEYNTTTSILIYCRVLKQRTKDLLNILLFPNKITANLLFSFFTFPF